MGNRKECNALKPIEDFAVLDFSGFSTTDPANAKWQAWSRVYEYEWVLKVIDELEDKSVDKPYPTSIHNTSWGFEGCHVDFKEELDSLGGTILHSDIRESMLDHTTVWDLLTDPPSDWWEAFDFVINVSTMEEVNGNHVEILRRLFSMVKPGGFLLCTFDLPGLQLPAIEAEIETNYKIAKDPVKGSNSICPQPRFDYLTFGRLVLQKVEE
jgi:SAM-dependent methyltransferase